MIRFRLVLTVLLMFAALFSVQATAASSKQTIQSQSSVLVGAEVFSQLIDLNEDVTNFV